MNREEKLKFAAEYGIYVQLQEDFSPLLTREVKPEYPKVAVCSIPKSGTYFLAELLPELGMVPCGIHVHEKGFTDYRFGTIEQKREEHSDMQRMCPPDQAIQLVGKGQFIQGHIPCDDKFREALGDFKKIFSHRDLRVCMVSQMRFYARTGRRTAWSKGWGKEEDPVLMMRGYLENEAEFFLEKRVKPVSAWLEEENVYALSYEDCMGQRGLDRRDQTIRDLCALLGIPTPDNIGAVLEKACGKDTITKSQKPTSIEGYWTDEAEDFFRKHGGLEINKRLGHESMA